MDSRPNSASSSPPTRAARSPGSASTRRSQHRHAYREPLDLRRSATGPVTFTSETASGWQSATFSHPVAINAGVTYVASVLHPNGHYSATPAGFGTPVDNAPLHGLANSSSANGLYAYTRRTVPDELLQRQQLLGRRPVRADVRERRARPALNVAATPGYGSATVTWTAPWDGGSPITGYTVTPYIGSTAQTPTTINGIAAGRRRRRSPGSPTARLHVHGQGHERERHRRPVGRHER